MTESHEALVAILQSAMLPHTASLSERWSTFTFETVDDATKAFALMRSVLQEISMREVWQSPFENETLVVRVMWNSL